jgi:hypothetical protein
METDQELNTGRRRTLATGSAMIAGLFAANAPNVAFGQTGPITPPGPPLPPLPPLPPRPPANLPVDDIERILRSGGRISGNVLHISQLRNDLNNVSGPSDIPIKPAFGVHNAFYFQGLPNGRVILNGELALRAEEIEAVIDRILATGLVFQALHQHFFNLEPQIWQVHLRGTGSAFGVARGLAYVVAATGTPLPQTLPLNPSSTLDAVRLARLLGGEAEIHEQGVVTVHLRRREQVTIGGTRVEANLGIGHEIRFEPLVDGRTAVAPKLALLGPEIGTVTRLLRREGYDVHALVNHETEELPQLYFCHLLVVGNPYYHARVIRRVLQQTNTRFLP